MFQGRKFPGDSLFLSFIYDDAIQKNLRAAFAGESQANRRYLAFSKKAADEEFHNITRLFRDVAESETIHAFNHLKSMDEVKFTLENVKVSLQGEQDKILSMYPMFIDQAKRDTDNAALNSFFGRRKQKNPQCIL